MLKDHFQKRVYEFITAHQIHTLRSFAADLEPLKKIFRFERIARSNPAYAFSLRPSASAPPSTPIKIYLNERMTFEERRIAIAHEVGHAILGHSESYTLFRLAPFFHMKEEKEAWQAAAILLIPIHAILESPHVRWLERVTMAPDWLINEYPYVQRAFSLPFQNRPAMFQ